MEQSIDSETETLQQLIESLLTEKSNSKLTFDRSLAHNVFNRQFIMNLIPLKANFESINFLTKNEDIPSLHRQISLLALLVFGMDHCSLARLLVSLSATVLP